MNRRLLATTFALCMTFVSVSPAHGQLGSEERSGENCPPGPFDCANTSSAGESSSGFWGWFCFWCSESSSEEDPAQGRGDAQPCDPQDGLPCPVEYDENGPLEGPAGPPKGGGVLTGGDGRPCNEAYPDDACPFRGPSSRPDPKALAPGHYELPEMLDRDLVQSNQYAMRGRLTRARSGELLLQGKQIGRNRTVRMRFVEMWEGDRAVAEEFGAAILIEELNDGQVVRESGLIVRSEPGKLWWSVGKG